MKRHLSFANVMSIAAVFIALGGGAYAINVGRAAIKTKNIKNNAVKTPKIANNAVTTPKIANNAVTAAKVKDAAVTPISATSGDCAAPGPGSYYTPMAWKDSEGIVHLQGSVVSCTGPTMFVLPVEFRPTLTLELTAFSGGSTAFAGSVVIGPDGSVTNSSGTNAGIHHVDGITYRQ